jgi:OFA family oxalate/formate antiporter-like MFS transporter
LTHTPATPLPTPTPLPASLAAPRRAIQALPLRPDFPIRPASFPFFYGWVVLVVSTIGIIMSVPGQTIGVSVFTDHLIDATGISRFSLSNAYLAGTLASGLALPYAGTLIDRFGVRAMVMAACFGLAATLCYLAACDIIALRIADALPLSTESTNWCVLAVGFAALRFSGQGILTMVSRTMVGRWFERGRGLVAAVSGPFVSFSFSAAPLMLHLLITSFGWREAWIGMAIAVGGGMSLIGWLFYRDSPEQCGLRMYGVDEADEANPSGEPRLDATRGFTRAEALRTSAFWLVSLAISNQALVGTGITFHIVDIGAEAGMAAESAVAIFLPVAIASTLVGFAVGYAIDRVSIRVLIMIMMAGQIGMFVGMASFENDAMRIGTIVCWGLASGFYGPLTVAALPGFFGREHLGAIQGAHMMIIVIASALGPATLASLHAWFGSYQIGFYVVAVMPFAVLVWAPFTTDPQMTSAD